MGLNPAELCWHLSAGFLLRYLSVDVWKASYFDFSEISIRQMREGMMINRY